MKYSKMKVNIYICLTVRHFDRLTSNPIMKTKWGKWIMYLRRQIPSKLADTYLLTHPESLNFEYIYLTGPYNLARLYEVNCMVMLPHLVRLESGTKDAKYTDVIQCLQSQGWAYATYKLSVWKLSYYQSVQAWSARRVFWRWNWV